MDPVTANDIVAGLADVTSEHPFRDEAAREAYREALSGLLTHVPEPNAWTVVRRGNGTALMLSDSLLFSLVVERIDGGGHPDALLASRWIEGHSTAVEVRWDAHAESPDGGAGYTTHWSFQIQDADPVALIGFVQTAPHEELDRTETFARAVARRAGWRLAG